MQLVNFLPTLLFLAPAFATPVTSAINCDSLLSFGSAGQHSVVSIRAFCNRRRKHKTKLEKRGAVTSIFDLQPARSTQPSDLTVTPTPHFILDTEDDLLQFTASQSAPHLLDDLELPTVHVVHTHNCQSPQVHRLAQAFARLQSSTFDALQSRTHGAIVAVHGMTANLIIAAMAAVSIVVLLLLACEQWLGARLKWARSESTQRRATTTTPSSTTSHSSHPAWANEKLPIILVTVVEDDENENEATAKEEGEEGNHAVTS